MKNQSKKMRTIFTFAIIALSINVYAQVPTNGLVGYWPFNGNANDESNNGNNGTVNGATLTKDRFGNVNKAYSFDGKSNYIDIAHNVSLNNLPISISVWFNTSTINPSEKSLVTKYSTNSYNGYSVHLNPKNIGSWYFGNDNNNIYYNIDSINQNIYDGKWHHVVAVYDNNGLQVYTDGLLINIQKWLGTPLITSTTENLRFGYYNGNINQYFSGLIDDIRIYNRALSQKETSALYAECDLSLKITPSDNSVASNRNTQFVVSSNDSNAKYQWQSNPDNYGWLDIPSNLIYTGGATKTLNVNNVQLSTHLQPFRVIATSGTCKDTSDIARIVISDTCIITVTDTLVINTSLAGFQAPNNKNTIKVYPNPTNDHITIDYGNFAKMNGYQLKIENSLGKQLFRTNITKQTDYLSLNNLGGGGLYFVHIIDAKGNTIDIRKIVLQ